VSLLSRAVSRGIPFPVNGRVPFVAFIDPRVPLVDVFGSGRAVTGPGVEQDNAIKLTVSQIHPIAM
jgi:hypothetical protein